MIPATSLLWFNRLNSTNSAKLVHSYPPVAFSSSSLMLCRNMFGTRACTFICMNTQSPRQGMSTLAGASLSRRNLERGLLRGLMCGRTSLSGAFSWPTYPQLIQIQLLGTQLLLIIIYLIMNETSLAQTFLNLVQESPNTFSFITLGIFCLCGYLASLLCMRCLKKFFGNVDEGLSQQEIRQIVEEERQRRIKKGSYKSGKKTLSPEQQADIQKRVDAYKQKIKKLMEESKNKKT